MMLPKSGIHAARVDSLIDMCVHYHTNFHVPDSRRVQGSQALNLNSVFPVFGSNVLVIIFDLCAYDRAAIGQSLYDSPSVPAQRAVWSSRRLAGLGLVSDYPASCGGGAKCH
jgi:hypothetical protein